MHLDILSHSKSLFSGEVDGVQLPGVDGSFEILNNHAPLIASLVQGSIRVNNGGQSTKIEIKRGLVEVANNKVIVLV